MAKISTPAWRDKQRIGSIMSRLERHANGEIEMTPAQVASAKAWLAKALPDLARTELMGKDGEDIKLRLSGADLDAAIAEKMKRLGL